VLSNMGECCNISLRVRCLAKPLFSCSNSGELNLLVSYMPLAFAHSAARPRVPWGGEGSRETRVVVKLRLG